MPTKQRVSLMSGQKRDRPERHRQENESKLVSFREWLSTTAGVIGAICAVITLAGGTIVVVKILAPHNTPPAHNNNAPTSMHDQPSSSSSPEPFNTTQLQSALLPSETVGPSANAQSSGTDLSQIEAICGGPVSGDSAAAYETIRNQQTGIFLDEGLVSWNSISDASQTITAGRQAIDRSGSCSGASNGATIVYSGDSPGSPPSSCVNPGQYLATQAKLSSPSTKFPYLGFTIVAQCGPTTIFIRVYSQQPGAVTQQVTDGYLSSAVGRLKSITS